MSTTKSARSFPSSAAFWPTTSDSSSRRAAPRATPRSRSCASTRRWPASRPRSPRSRDAPAAAAERAYEPPPSLPPTRPHPAPRHATTETTRCCARLLRGDTAGARARRQRRGTARTRRYGRPVAVLVHPAEKHAAPGHRAGRERSGGEGGLSAELSGGTRLSPRLVAAQYPAERHCCHGTRSCMALGRGSSPGLFASQLPEAQPLIPRSPLPRLPGMMRRWSPPVVSGASGSPFPQALRRTTVFPQPRRLQRGRLSGGAHLHGPCVRPLFCTSVCASSHQHPRK